MWIFNRFRKRGYGEPEDSSVNWFVLVLVLAGAVLLCFLLYVLLYPLLNGKKQQETQIVPYGWGTVTPGVALQVSPVLPSAIPSTTVPVAVAGPALNPVQPITAANVGGLETVAKLFGHSSPVSSVVVSPDAQRIVSGDWDGTVRVWDVANGTQVGLYRSPSNRVDSVAISPTGQEIAAGGQDSVVRRWDVASGASLDPLTGPAEAIRAVAYSPDGSLLAAASDDSRVYLWQLPTGTMIGALSGLSSYATSVAFSPDGTLVAAGSEDDTIQVWGIPSGVELMVLRGHTSTVTAIAFSPDGSTLASSSADHTVRLWNLLSESQAALLAGHTGTITSVAYSRDGALLASGANGIDDNTVRLWDARTGSLLRTIYPDGPVNSVAFSPDGLRFVTGGATFLAIWGVPETATVQIIPTPTYYIPPTVITLPDGQGGQSGEVCVLTVRAVDAALRAGPGPDYAAVSTLLINQTIQADGWSQDAEGFTWWRIGASGWLRGDAVLDAANPTLPDACWTLPQATGLDSAAPTAIGVPATTATLPAQTGGACLLTVRVNEANVRAGAGTSNAQVATLALGESVQAVGWTTGPEGFTWWRLSTGGWARGDVFVDALNPSVPDACLSLPYVG